MTRFILRLAVLNLAYFLPYSQLVAAPPLVQDATISSEGIHIQVTERALEGVLLHIQQVSGIRFSFSDILGTIQITATLNAPDWGAASRQLLRPFSTVEVWDKNQLVHVFILERGTGKNPAQNTWDASEGVGQSSEDTDLPVVPPVSSLSLLPPPPPPPPL